MNVNTMETERRIALAVSDLQQSGMSFKYGELPDEQMTAWIDLSIAAEAHGTEFFQCCRLMMCDVSVACAVRATIIENWDTLDAGKSRTVVLEGTRVTVALRKQEYLPLDERIVKLLVVDDDACTAVHVGEAIVHVDAVKSCKGGQREG